MKICSHCKIKKSLDNFSKKKDAKDGLQHICKFCNKISITIYNKIHKKELSVYKTKWEQKNYKRRKEQRILYKERKNKLAKILYKTNINTKLANILRTRLCGAIKTNQKAGSAVRDLGCSIQELKKYLEKQFKRGMTWSNWTTYGWHIDHIKPLSFFDLTNRKQFLEACHYTNLQPLWWHENLKKLNKINE